MDFWAVVLLNSNALNIDLASWQVGLLLPTTISLRIHFPLTEGQSWPDWVMGFWSRYKRKELGCPGWDWSSHMQNGHKQDKEWECAVRQSSAQRNWLTAGKEEKYEQDLNCVCVGSWGLVLYISHAHHASVLILLLRMTVVWELLKGERSGWRARRTGLQGAQRGRCWALSQRGLHPHFEWTFIASHRWILKRNVLQLFERGLQMFYSAGKRPFLSVMCVCVFTLVCVCGTVQFQQPSILLSLFAVRGNGIKPYCFYSISCHYQRQFDYWVHLAGREQWQQQAVFLFSLPPILSCLLEN